MPKRPSIIWSEVDWNKRNCEIAERVGRSESAVRQARARWGTKPLSDYHGDAPKHRAEAAGDLSHMSATQIADMFCVSTGTVATWVRRGIIAKPVDRRHGGRENRAANFPYNWDLPNYDLARIWGFSYNTIANLRGGAIPRWHRVGHTVPADQNYQRAIEEETLKAADQPRRPSRPGRKKTKRK